MNAKQGQRLGIILVLAGFAVGIPGFWLLIAHDHFEATARIRIEQSMNSSISARDFFQTEVEIIHSESVLTNVVVKLDLNSEWGNRYANGVRLNTSESVGLLRQSTHLRDDNDSWFYVVSVIGEDSVEASKIANAVAEAYRVYHEELRPQATIVKITASAQPPTIPIGPNRTLGKALIGVGVLLLVYGFVTFVRNWRKDDSTVFHSP